MDRNATRTPIVALPRWTGTFRDVVIVVLGVLIAFTLDAWWERQRNEMQEEVHLRALRADFQANVARLQALIRREERTLRSNEALLALSRQRGPMPLDSVGRVMAVTFSSYRFEPVMGAYEAVNSLGLSLIRDDSLRRMLAQFSAALENRYYETFADELYLSFTRAFVGRLPFLEEIGRDSAAAAYEEYASLLDDPRFRQYLALRQATERSVAERYRYLLQLAESIVARLDAVLRSPSAATEPPITEEPESRR